MRNSPTNLRNRSQRNPKSYQNGQTNLRPLIKAKMINKILVFIKDRPNQKPPMKKNDDPLYLSHYYQNNQAYSRSFFSFRYTSSPVLPSTTAPLCRLLLPRSKYTALFLTPSTSARNLINSSFASPSLAGAAIATPINSSLISATRLALLFGFASITILQPYPNGMMHLGKAETGSGFTFSCFL